MYFEKCTNSGKIESKEYQAAGTLYGSSENGVTCEGCTNYAASVFTGYSLWIIAACTVVMAAAVVWVISAKNKRQMANL